MNDPGPTALIASQASEKPSAAALLMSAAMMNVSSPDPSSAATMPATAKPRTIAISAVSISRWNFIVTVAFLVVFLALHGVVADLGRP